MLAARRSSWRRDAARGRMMRDQSRPGTRAAGALGPGCGCGVELNSRVMLQKKASRRADRLAVGRQVQRGRVRHIAIVDAGANLPDEDGSGWPGRRRGWRARPRGRDRTGPGSRVPPRRSRPPSRPGSPGPPSVVGNVGSLQNSTASTPASEAPPGPARQRRAGGRAGVRRPRPARQAGEIGTARSRADGAESLLERHSRPFVFCLLRECRAVDEGDGRRYPGAQGLPEGAWPPGNDRQGAGAGGRAASKSRRDNSAGCDVVVAASTSVGRLTAPIRLEQSGPVSAAILRRLGTPRPAGARPRRDKLEAPGPGAAVETRG